MKRTAILASAGAVALWLSCTVCGEPAVAQNSQIQNGPKVNIDLKKLPPARFTPSPWQIQIINAAPKVTDCREQQTNQNFELRIPPLAPAQTQTSVIEVPGGGGDGNGTMAGGAPGTVTINGSRPPRSRFDTNIPAGGMAPRNSLPNGTTTNRLMGADANARGRMNPPQAVPIRKRALLDQTTVRKPAPSPTETKMYDPPSSGSGTGSSSIAKTVTTNVSGKVKRGEYLKPPH